MLFSSGLFIELLLQFIVPFKTIAAHCAALCFSSLCRIRLLQLIVLRCVSAHCAVIRRLSFSRKCFLHASLSGMWNYIFSFIPIAVVRLCTETEEFLS